MCKKFAGLSDAKVKGSIFMGSTVRKLINDEKFQSAFLDVKKKKNKHVCLKAVIKKFLGNFKDPNYKPIVNLMLGKLKVITL